jgi:glutamate racemase
MSIILIIETSVMYLILESVIHTGMLKMKNIFRQTAIIIFITSAISVNFGCGSDQPPAQAQPGTLVELIGQNESELFPIAPELHQLPSPKLPIGVFDSGIGGLTVLAEIVRLDNFNNVTHVPGPDGIPDFEDERFIYLGDQANMPYGNYSAENKTEFLRELIVKDAAFLLGRRYWPSKSAVSPMFDKPPVKSIVIACNTATAFGINHLRDTLTQWNIPVYIIGVVNAGAEGAIENIRKSGAVRNEQAEIMSAGAVAVMATVGTCSSDGYVRALEQSASDAGIDIAAVIQQGCFGLAGAIEGDSSYITAEDGSSGSYQGPSQDNPNAPIDMSLLARYSFESSGIIGDANGGDAIRLNSVENYIRYHTTTLVENYREAGNTRPIGTVILGCTHFPFQAEAIGAAFERLRTFEDQDGSRPYGGLIAEQIGFIDPAQFTAVQLYENLRDSELLLEEPETAVIDTDEFYISLPHSGTETSNLTESGGFTYDFKYGRVPGSVDVEYVKRVPMSLQTLSPAAIGSISDTMPWIIERLAKFNAESPRCKGIPATERIAVTR